MKPFRLMHLLRHIVQKSDCPHCHSQILPETIRVDMSSDDAAMLSICCPHCSHNLQAHVFANFTDPEAAKEVEQLQGEITEAEMKKAQEILAQHSGSLTDLFPSKK